MNERKDTIPMEGIIPESKRLEPIRKARTWGELISELKDLASEILDKVEIKFSDWTIGQHRGLS